MRESEWVWEQRMISVCCNKHTQFIWNVVNKFDPLHQHSTSDLSSVPTATAQDSLCSRGLSLLPTMHWQCPPDYITQSDAGVEPKSKSETPIWNYIGHVITPSDLLFHSCLNSVSLFSFVIKSIKRKGRTLGLSGTEENFSPKTDNKSCRSFTSPLSLTCSLHSFLPTF